MNKVTKKIRSNKGESLIESLVSILIFTLASIMLYTMLSTSVKLNQAAKDADAKHELEMIYAEHAEDVYGLESGKGGAGRVKIALDDGGAGRELINYKVNLHRLDEDSLYSYEKD